MLCRSTSTGVLSTLLPIVSSHPQQTGLTSIADRQMERSSSDLYQYCNQASVSTPRSGIQSPASQHLKPATDLTRCTDGGDWDFEGASSSVVQGPSGGGRFRRVQSENDLQSLWRTSSGSAATFAAAGSFNSTTASQGGYDDDQFGVLDRLDAELGSTILEMSENSEEFTPGGSEISEEPREMLSMMDNTGFWNESTMEAKQYSGQFNDEPAIDNGRAARSLANVSGDPTSLRSIQQETRGVIRSRSTSTLEPPRGKVLERSFSSSQNDFGGAMFITDIGFGNGNGGGGRVGVSGGRGGGSGDSNGVEAQYRRMLEADPGHPLLLRNYARFLHEVKREPLEAEPYYQRAILANPGDGEVLGHYAQLIWDVYKDEDRATGYFDQALKACPDDWYLNAAYASFLWSLDGEEDSEVDRTQEVSHGNSSSGYINNMPPMYGAAAVSA